MPSTRLARRKGKMLPGQMASVLAAHHSGGNMEGMLWKSPTLGSQKGYCKYLGEKRIKSEMESFDSEQKRIISVLNLQETQLLLLGKSNSRPNYVMRRSCLESRNSERALAV